MWGRGEMVTPFSRGHSKVDKACAPICIQSDSQSAIDRAQSNMYNGKSRNIRRRHNTIR